MADQICIVSFTDKSGTRRSAEVTADSLFEAAILGMKALRMGNVNEPSRRATIVEVEIKSSGVKHRVSTEQVARWLNGPSRTPRESMKKVGLRRFVTSK